MLFLLSVVFLGAVARLNLAAPQLGGQKEGQEEGEAPYSVLQKFDGYEERLYPTTNWVCSSGGFMKLFGYISGANSAGETIPMTAPVLNKGKTMCFYLSENFQANPPQPISSSVGLVQREQSVVMARRIGGRPNMKKEAFNFAKMLISDGKGEEVDLANPMTMGYDSPWANNNRRNDVLFNKI